MRFTRRMELAESSCMTSMKAGTFVFGALCGSGLMYLMDPQKGEERRKAVKDTVGALFGRSTTRKAAVEEPHVADDQVLVERIRAEIGHVISYPRDIEIYASSGRVLVSGKISGDEAEQLLECVRQVKGVVEVDDDLEVHGFEDMSISPVKDSTHVS